MIITERKKVYKREHKSTLSANINTSISCQMENGIVPNDPLHGRCRSVVLEDSGRDAAPGPACLRSLGLIPDMTAPFPHVMLMHCFSNLQLGCKSITPQTPLSSPRQELSLTTAILGHMTSRASCKCPYSVPRRCILRIKTFKKNSKGENRCLIFFLLYSFITYNN